MVKIIVFFLSRKCIPKGRQLNVIDSKRLIQVECRIICHSVDLAVLRIHNDYQSAFRVFSLHCGRNLLLGILLYDHVNACNKVFAVYRLDSFLRVTDPSSFGVRKRKQLSGLALKIFLVFALQAYYSLIILSYESYNACRQRIIRICSLHVLIYHNSRQFQFSQL